MLGDFHVCLAECLGNQLLADTLRDFTARTTLIAMLYQSTHDAEQSCEDHVAIVQALEQGDSALAEHLMQEHIGQVQAALRVSRTQRPHRPFARGPRALARAPATARAQTPSTPNRQPFPPPSTLPKPT